MTGTTALPSVAAGLLPQALASFAQSHPYIDVVIRDQLSGTLYQAMRERQIDLAITTPPEDDAFYFAPILEDPVVLVVRKGGLLDNGLPATWSILADHPFIAMSPNSSVRPLTDAAMIMAGVQARALYDCAQLTTLRALVEAGLGISALPESAARMLLPGQLSLRSLSDPVMTRTLGLTYPSSRTLAPAAQSFASHFCAVRGIGASPMMASG